MHFILYFGSILNEIPVYSLRLLSVFTLTILDGFYAADVVEYLFEISFVVVESSRIPHFLYLSL